jgi:hypothetical protein
MIKDVIIHNVRRVIAIAHADSSIQHTAGAQQIRNTRFNAGSLDRTHCGAYRPETYGTLCDTPPLKIINARFRRARS